MRSYRTLSPLPPAYRGRSTLCGTFPRVAAAGRYPACRLSWSPDLPLKPRSQRTPASSSRAKHTTGEISDFGFRISNLPPTARISDFPPTDGFAVTNFLAEGVHSTPQRSQIRLAGFCGAGVPPAHSSMEEECWR